jgi:DNA-binding transcriptional LysR family regulator
MFPVCGAEFAASAELRTPRDLASHTLLHVSRRAEGWPEWLAAAKAEGLETCEVDPHHGPKFDTIQLTFTAAAEGLGVAIGRLPLVEDHLRNGVLVEVFAPLRVKSQNAYWLLSAANAPLSEGAAKLRAWMREELGLER